MLCIGITMTKNIAVIGCSFSAFWQGDDTCNGPNYDVVTWSNLLSQNFDVKIDTFAHNGASSGYLMYCLNYILHSNKKYDLILGNIPPLNRDWYFSYNPYNDVEVFHRLQDIDSWFIKKQITDNVTEYFSDTPVTTHSHENNAYVMSANDTFCSNEEKEYVANLTSHIKNNFFINQRKNLQTIEIIKQYYSVKLPLVFWYHVENMFTEDNSVWKTLARHTLDHTELPAKEFFKKKYHRHWKDIVVDAAHFSSYGHEQLLEKYILKDKKISEILIQ